MLAAHCSVPLCGGGERTGKLQPYGGAAAFSLRFGDHVSAVLAGDGADQEEAQAGAFDAEDIAGRHPVEALEDSLQVQRRNAQAMIGNRKHHPRLAVEREMHLQLRPLGRILDRVIENVEHGGAQVLRVADHGELLGIRVHGELDGRLLQMVALQRGADAVANHVVEEQLQTDLVACSLAHLSRLEHLLHGGQEPLAVGEHDVVELLPLRLRHLVPLQGFQIQADGGDGGLEFVGDGIEKAVVALVALDLTHQKYGVQNQTGDQQQEEENADDQQDHAAPVDDDPGDVEGDGNRDQAGAESDGKNDRISASGDTHTRQALAKV